MYILKEKKEKGKKRIPDNQHVPVRVCRPDSPNN